LLLYNASSQPIGILPRDTEDSKESTEFRPISVLPVLSKVLERVVYDQLLSYLLKHNLQQSGFRPHYSTPDVRLNVTDSWRRAIDESKFTAAAFLDILKAFDCVNHDKLLSKLACYGILEHSLVRFTSYLSCRRQQVCLQGVSSMWGEIHIGVPQGSILGPLLFSIYINDLHNIVKVCELNLYADDMELHCSNDDLSSVYSSCQKLRGNDLHVTVDGKQLSRVSSVKYLGLHLDEHLTWHQHMANVLQRVYSRVHCLYRLHPLPAALLSRLYSVFVLPIWYGHHNLCNIFNN